MAISYPSRPPVPAAKPFPLRREFGIPIWGWTPNEAPVNFTPLIRRALLAPLLLAPAVALAQAAPAPPASSNFAGLFTSWSGTSRESLRSETARQQPSGAVPASSPLQRSHGQAAALGERVGEIVRRGDCEEGERIAREAGDFALVRAVRDHCRASSASS